MKKPSDYPRYVVYFTEEESKQIVAKAKKDKMSKPQKWIAKITRRELDSGRSLQK